ncbi:hypothetical protein PV10_07598 [Exophiala mesophila]|uniref:Uncharacterized protein n=1 Tax=Exophiala mesophila TaxID=212818 RepID=A0A0D1Z8A9_EXOME|nr:uncharacterized protein PV10_07598 [Exophiala mesophila]KIV90279.1 hypothetical protein PV10_07598 [Exophiala mesophila]
MSSMTLVTRPREVREDEHYIDFGNTQSFAATKWSTAVEAQEITAADWHKARNVDNYDEFGNWLRRCIQDSKNPQQRSYLQSLILIARPMYGFIFTFEKLVAPEKVDMSIIWGLMFININLALQQAEKLKRLTPWLLSLKRSMEALNQCVENFSDENSARQQVTDVFDPLLNLLTGMIKFQRTYLAGNMKEFVTQNIDQIDDVIYHFRQISQHSKAAQELSVSRHSHWGVPFREQTNPYDRAAFPLDNLPDIRTEHFYGRESSIEHIHNHLGNQTNEKLRTYLIYGLRGVGKTQIALEFARRYKSKFDAVFWIRCETSASLRQSFSDIAVRLELSSADQMVRFEENQLKVLEWFKKTNKTWLLIYDNAEREQALNSYWPRESVGSVLLTSRSYYNFEHSERREGETIPVFSDEERWDLLMELLGPEWQHRHLGGAKGRLEREAARKLLEHLGGLALAIAQASKLILDKELTGDQSIVTLLEIFDKASKQLPPRFSGHRNEKIHALDTIWSIALNTVSRNARSLLSVFSLLAPDSIPVDLFLPGDQARLDGKLAFCKQDESYVTALQMSPGMEIAVKELQAAGLIRQDGRNFVIHRVIQEAMNYIDLGEIQESFDAATELLHEAFPKQIMGRPLQTMWPRCMMFVQHVVHLTKAFSTYQTGSQGYVTPKLNFIRLLSNCGWYLYEVADYTECLEMMAIACSASDDKGTLLYSHLLNAQGAAYYDQNKLKKAREAFNTARVLRERWLESNHPLVASSIANIANIECALGYLDDAQQLYEQAARIRESHGEDELPMLGLNIMSLGRVAFLRGETHFAIKLYDRAEACFMRKPNASQHLMAALHYARGNLELESRNYAQATAQYEKCRDLCHILWPVHPLAAATWYKLGVVEMERAPGRRYHDKALSYLEKAYNIATIRSSGDVDGTVARIMWRWSEILIEDPLQRLEGIKMRDGLKLDVTDIAMDLNITVHPEWSETETFDRLVPGYFR